MKRLILVVDDTPVIREQLRLLLEGDGYEVDEASDGREALDRVRFRTYDLLITDWRMPNLDGLGLLNAVRGERLPLGVIMLTGFGDTPMALEAMKAGADDLLTKPFEPERIRFAVHRVLERRQLIDNLDQLRHQMRENYSFHNLVSKSPRMRKIFDLIEQVGPLRSTVLIQGETGTGKELVAQAIHAADGRRQGPWVALNCAALPDTLLESELFGHERGAFTGAQRRREGRFELADGGTLFLDEIADISPAMQAKLLRVLQAGMFERVGGTEALQADVRVIAASNKRLDEQVRIGRFRTDLFYRLNVIRIDLPPLRERPEDIPLLAAHLLDKLRCRQSQVTEIGYEAMQALVSHSWPGNVRELENAIQAAVALADGPIIHLEDLPATITRRPAESPGAHSLIDICRALPELTNDLIHQVEREYFAQLLARHRGNVARCARHSGLSRRSVTQKLKKLALDRREFKLGRPARAAEPS